MNFHLLAVIVLIVYGLFKEFRPVLPYFNEYLTTSRRNFTDEVLNHQVYPVWTYAYLGFLLPVLLLSDYTRHFIFVILGNCGQLVTMVSMIFGTSISAMKIMEVGYGLATACEVAYTSFVYSMVESSEDYQKITSWMRASVLVGMSSSFATGQILILVGINDLDIHAYISLAAVVISFMLVSSLRCWPQLKQRTEPKRLRNVFSLGFLNAYKKQCRRFKNCYNSLFLAKWSMFWALSTCGHLQVSNFVQNLWSTIAEENGESVAYNGLTEAINALTGAAGAFIVQYVHLNWFFIGDICLFAVLGFQTALLVAVSRTNTLVVAYVLQVFYCFLYQTSTTVSTFLIAREAPAKYHGLIFGTNTFLSLCLQTILTLVVADSSGLALPVKFQVSSS
uniref:Reduced folate carrier n=1 Tax=Trichuris muris TaxID=70415 RepID=A0A5S6QZR1_TRIMR